MLALRTLRVASVTRSASRACRFPSRAAPCRRVSGRASHRASVAPRVATDRERRERSRRRGPAASRLMVGRPTHSHQSWCFRGRQPARAGAEAGPIDCSSSLLVRSGGPICAMAQCMYRFYTASQATRPVRETDRRLLRCVLDPARSDRMVPNAGARRARRSLPTRSRRADSDSDAQTTRAKRGRTTVADDTFQTVRENCGCARLQPSRG